MNPLASIRPFVPPEVKSLPLNQSGLDPFSGLQAAPLDQTREISRNAELGSVSSPTEPVHSFSNVLGQLVNETTARSTAASEAVGGVLAGENVPLHQAMIAMEEASISFQLMVEVRNKLLESYQELMRMQV